MASLPKPLQYILMLAVACAAAGVFGALHNQLSFTIGPSYFYDLKFAQFGIAEGVSPRLGAANVGWQASWWMGLVLGVPLFALLLWRDARDIYAKTCWDTLKLVLSLTAVAAVFGALAGIVLITPEAARHVIGHHATSDALGFARAAVMHEASYAGGLAGAGVVGVRMIWQAMRNDGGI